MPTIFAITLFVEDLAAAKAWYQTVFAIEPVYADEVSTAYPFGDTVINLLQATEAGELIGPAPVGDAAAGRRAQYTINLPDVTALEAKVAELRRLGIDILNGPLDRAWGIRTAALADPAGHVWELAAPLG